MYYPNRFSKIVYPFLSDVRLKHFRCCFTLPFLKRSIINIYSLERLRIFRTEALRIIWALSQHVCSTLHTMFHHFQGFNLNSQTFLGKCLQLPHIKNPKKSGENFSEQFSGKEAIKFQVAFWPSWMPFVQKPDHHVLRCEGIHNFSRRGSSSPCLNTYLGISMELNRGR